MVSAKSSLKKAGSTLKTLVHPSNPLYINKIKPAYFQDPILDHGYSEGPLVLRGFWVVLF